MGSFTTILLNRPDMDGNPETEVQIKTGRDQFHTYRLGDHVDWMVDPDRVGVSRLLDGVYVGVSGNLWDSDAWYVAIKDHVVVEIVELDEPDDGYSLSQIGQLRSKWDIPETPPSDLWTAEAWERHAEDSVLTDEEFARYKAARCADIPIDRKPETPSEEINAALMQSLQQAGSENPDVLDTALLTSFFFSRALRMPSFYQRILPGLGVEQIELDNGNQIRKDHKYNHFGRQVTVSFIYPRASCGFQCVEVIHEKGTRRHIDPHELEEL